MTLLARLSLEIAMRADRPAFTEGDHAMSLKHTRGLSLLLAALFALLAGNVLADTRPAADGVIVAQSPTQDPNTPPDCKKYPQDVRCKK
ncbi:MAG TPA: hypothetical protein VFO57_07180 [Burkholderiales bacterium]|nr:hypothetical protein [Burkholderiales bacterium]